jgi:3-oxoacyl-[acyl-carrier protein] reductase
MQRTILVTGASSGIGAATARALARRFRLVLVARRADRLRELCMAITADGGSAVAVAEDLGDQASYARIATACGPLDGLVNNAGVFELADGAEITAAHLERIWRINVTAPMLLTAACLPLLRPGSTIVNVSSAVVEAAFARCGAYTASKCALEGWSRVLREELRPRRIRVCLVAPGATDTEIWPADFAGADRAQMVRAADVGEAIAGAIGLHPAASCDRIVLTPASGAI